MARQRTFDLVPTSLVHPNNYKPPMTSKQVKRAYQKANQIDKLTRAEQRQLEAKELRRLKAEYLREEASAKARTIKENKISKALIEAELRKKSGLPPKPKRHVRNRSQTTISLYTRCSYPIARNLQKIKTKAEKDSDLCKKQIDKDENEEMKQDIMKVLCVKKCNNDSDSSEDEFGGFPFCTQLETIVDSIDSKEKSLVCPVPQISKKVERKVSKFKSSRLSLQSDLPKEKICNDSQLDASQHPLRLVISKEQSSRADDRNLEQGTENLNPQTKGYKVNEPPINPINIPNMCASSSTTVENGFNISNPIISIKGQTPLSCEMSHLQGFSIPKGDIKIPRVTFRDDNSPTVDFELSDEFLDDFLSSSTQDIENCHDDDIDAAFFPSNTQIMSEINSTESTYSRGYNLNSFPEPQLTKLKKNDKINSSVESTENQYIEASTSARIKQQDYFDDLICTQDLVLLSQELQGMNVPLPDMSKLKQSPPQEKVRGKKRFFEEKEEDLLKAALYESKLMASKSSSSKPLRQELELSIDTAFPSDQFTSLSSPGTDYGADDFAGNEWDELSALCEP